jgi:sulfur relay (sulfurtransferase) DsrF/TusC family protein
METLMIVMKTGPGEVARVGEGFRLSAAMLGYDRSPVIVFVDDGVECLRAGAFEDSTLEDYLQASSDLAGIYALSESMEARGILPGDLDEKIEVTVLDLDGLAGMMLGCDAVATY